VGGTVDIFHMLMIYCLEPVMYLDPISTFPETIEKPEYFVGFADNVGYAFMDYAHDIIS
jgi:hypothetical protein